VFFSKIKKNSKIEIAVTTYTVIIKKSAQKQIAAIPFLYIAAIEKAVLAFASNPHPTGCKKLTPAKIYI